MLLFLLLTGINIPPSLTIPNVPLTFLLKYSYFKREWTPYAKSFESSDKTCKISFWFKKKDSISG